LLQSGRIVHLCPKRIDRVSDKEIAELLAGDCDLASQLQPDEISRHLEPDGGGWCKGLGATKAGVVVCHCARDRHSRSG
jgi:hypothetical protein